MDLINKEIGNENDNFNVTLFLFYHRGTVLQRCLLGQRLHVIIGRSQLIYEKQIFSIFFYKDFQFFLVM